MTVCKPIILMPARFSEARFDLEVTANGVPETLKFPPLASPALVEDRNYWFSGDGEADVEGGENGIGDVFALLADTLNSHTELSGVLIEYTEDYLIRVSASVAFTIEFGDVLTTLDNAIFGAKNGDEVSALDTGLQRVTFARRPQKYWRPRQAWSEDSRDRSRILTGVSESLNGCVYRTRLVEGKKARQFVWTVLEPTRVLEEYGDDTGGSAPDYDLTQTDTYEYLWRTTLTCGFPVRVYEDQSELVTKEYQLYRSNDKTEQLSRNGQYRLRWDVRMGLRRVLI